MIPMLPTTVVGSYSVPEWLERLKTDYYRNRISRSHLGEIHDMAIKAALKDQEKAGIDIVSDGELRRDNDIDYFLARIPGVQILVTVKSFYFDYYDTPIVTKPLPADPPPLGLADDYRFTRQHTDRPVKFSFTGPFSLSHRIQNKAYAKSADLVRALAQVLNAEAQRLAEAGAELLQIDEPFLAGYPEDVGIAVEAINIVTQGLDVTWGLHVCYGNRYARPSWEGHYDFLFPAVLDANVDQLILEFARKGYEDLHVIQRLGWDRALGLGVVDVKTEEVESAELIAQRIRKALETFPADKLIINPDCGLRHLPADVARSKLTAMVEGTAAVRRTLPDQVGPAQLAEPGKQTVASPEPTVAQGA
ncbi:MAG: methionine synthase [Actinomycetota bacterium]|nr:methionine synthase [Actinomycetota bacterium]